MIFLRLLPQLIESYSMLYTHNKGITSRTINVCANTLVLMASFYVHHLVYINYFTTPNHLIEYYLHGMIVVSTIGSFPAELYKIYLMGKAIVYKERHAITDNVTIKNMLRLSTDVAAINLTVLLLTAVFSDKSHNLRLLVLTNIYYLLNNTLDIAGVLIFTIILLQGVVIFGVMCALTLTLLVFYATVIHAMYPEVTNHIARILDGIYLDFIGQLLGVQPINFNIPNINGENDQQVPAPNLDELFRNINGAINQQAPPAFQTGPIRPTQAQLDEVTALCVNVDASDTEICTICRHTNTELANNDAKVDDADENDANADKADESDGSDTKADESDESEKLRNNSPLGAFRSFTRKHMPNTSRKNTFVQNMNKDPHNIFGEQQPIGTLSQHMADGLPDNLHFREHTDRSDYMTRIDTPDFSENVSDISDCDYSDDDLPITSSEDMGRNEISCNVIQWVKLPNCTHKFHKLCISGWLMTGNTSCPVCRADIN